MPDPIIELKKLNFIYDQGKPNEQHALKDIELTIDRGDYVAFFGPSGCGKSTLLYSIAGIQPPTSGEILVEKRDIAKADADTLSLYRQTEVGIIFQNFNLLPSLSVMDNVAMPMSFMGVGRFERNERAMEALKRLEMDHLAKRYPFELSGGQQQRVAIARALVNTPPLMLADEPLGNLDSENAERVLKFLRELNEKDGETVIMVTHEAWSLRDAKKIFHMKDGVITKVEVREHGALAVVSRGSAEGNAEKARGFSEFLLPGFPKEQTERLKGFVSELLDGTINIEQFKDKLDEPWKEGGVGLWRQRAAKIAEAMKRAIEESKDVDKIGKKLHENPQATLTQEVQRIREWLFEDGTALDKKHILAVDSLVEARLRGKLAPDEFATRLALPRVQGGAGLRSERALRINGKMQALLGVHS